jgi:hypothetical protein
MIGTMDHLPIDTLADCMPQPMTVKQMAKAPKVKKLKVKKKPKIISLAATLDPYTATPDPLHTPEYARARNTALLAKCVEARLYGFTSMHNPTFVDNKISNLRNAQNVAMSVTIDAKGGSIFKGTVMDYKDYGASVKGRGESRLSVEKGSPSRSVKAATQHSDGDVASIMISPRKLRNK